MPSVRYYDYGAMQRAAERRVYDMQRAARQACPTESKHPAPEISVDRRAASRPIPVDLRGAACSAEECRVEPDCPCEETCKPSPSPPAKTGGMVNEELLILALLVLVLSDGGNLPVALALLYLLM